jgi:histidine ammonia-lyase
MVEIGKRDLSLKDLYRIIICKEKIHITSGSIARVQKGFQFLSQFIPGKVIYGINTGFGPMAEFIVDNKLMKELQYNLIRSHSAGAGSPISNTLVKSLMLARLNSLLRGYSGVHPNTIILIKEFINNDIYPFIPEHGGVGASGDLVQLAHLALALIGEGEVFYKGKLVPTKKVLKQKNIKPLQIYIREGLSLINGTSVMTGIGALNLIAAKNLIYWSIVASSMVVEIVESYDDSFSKELNAVKYHSGQNKVAEMLRKILIDSKLIRKRPDHLYNGNNSHEMVKSKVQDCYSIRCVPQIIGPILDAIVFAEKVVVDELNSVSDNPVIDIENQNIFHGGNFHGDYISFEMDKIKIAVTKLSMLMERQLNFLFNDKLNNKLPPFINLGKLGLNLGMQGMQFTATSTVAENQTYSFPMYVHSIPNNNDNQDIVSMGTNSALIAKKVIDNSYEVLAILLIAIIQAVDYLKISKSLSKYNRKIYIDIRKIVPIFIKDSIKYKDIIKVKEHVLDTQLNLI